jgi:hypothetical protein
VLPKLPVPDDFYPGISIHRNLLRPPSSILAIHQKLLQDNGFPVTEPNLQVVLSASKKLYTFLSNEASSELAEYSLSLSRKRRPVRGPVVIQFDLVVEIISQLLMYTKQHPIESLSAAASLAVLEDYFEQKLGKIGRLIWKKIRLRKVDSSPNKEILLLLMIEKTRSKRRQSRQVSSRKSSPRRRRTFSR